jgi:hypothetical protein
LKDELLRAEHAGETGATNRVPTSLAINRVLPEKTRLLGEWLFFRRKMAFSMKREPFIARHGGTRFYFLIKKRPFIACAVATRL